MHSLLAVLIASLLGAAQAIPLNHERANTVPTSGWDYIVVGGGAGGLVVSDRLAEAGKSVLLIERGPPSTTVTGGKDGPDWAISRGLTRFDIPGLCNEIWVDSSGIACSDIDQMAGCLLGGGTAVNSGLFFHAPDQDFNIGFPTGWKATDMTSSIAAVFNRIPSTDTPSMDGKRYFQESFNVLSSTLAPNGWTQVTANQSPNAKNRTFAHTPYMYQGGERNGPLATYLQSARGQQGFQYVTNSTVNRVIRNGATITGVNVTAYGANGLNGIYSVKPNTGRVVLSAGTFGTAKILLRSGIGPLDMLTVVNNSAADGPTFLPQSQWINLPVGYNIMDHTDTDVVIQHPDVITYDWYAAYTDPIQSDMTQYLNSRAGVFTDAAPAVNTMAWETFPGSKFSDGILRQVQWTARVEGSLGFTGDGMVTLSQYLGTGMSSRGRMSIRSNLNMAVTTLPYARTQDDINAIIMGVQSLVDSLSTNPNITFLSPAPGVDATTYVNTYFSSRRSNHWLGSAKMGPDDGRNFGGVSGSVVDLNTKVYGTNNLFVVDASIFPSTVSTNPSAIIMAVAEKAAQKILALK